MTPGSYELLLYKDESVDTAKTLLGLCEDATPELTKDNLGVLLSFLKRASKGLLIHEDDDKDIQPCASQPNLWELYPLTDDRLERAYSGEPAAEPFTVVVLHAHKKEIGGNKEEIRAWQNSEMKIAQQLFDFGRTRRWGHDPVAAARKALGHN